MAHRGFRRTVRAAGAGLVGGLVGTAVMGAYWKVLVDATGTDPRKKKKPEPGPLGDIAVVRSPMKPGEEPTATVGRLAYEGATGRPPAPERKKALAQAVHWGYGGLQGALYGALRARRTRFPDLAGGALFGTALWGVSELVLPLLGLGRGPTAYPAGHHASTWGAHALYGAAAATVAQALAGR